MDQELSQIACHKHKEKVIRVTYDDKYSNQGQLISKLICSKCQDQLRLLTSVKITHFAEIYTNWALTLTDKMLSNKSQQISKCFDQMIDSLKKAKDQLINKVAFKKEHGIFDQSSLNFILWKYMHGLNPKDQTDILKVFNSKKVIDQQILKRAKLLSQNVNSSLLKFMKQISDMKGKSSQQLIKSFQILERQTRKQKANSYQGCSESEQNQMPMKRKKRKYNQQQCMDKKPFTQQIKFSSKEPASEQVKKQQCQAQSNISNKRERPYKTEQSSAVNFNQNANQTEKDVQQKQKNPQPKVSEKEKLKSAPTGPITMPIQMKVPSNGRFSAAHPGIKISDDKLVCSVSGQQNVLFALYQPMFSRQHNSRLIKILSMSKHSEILLGAGFKQNIQNNNFADNYGYHQGVFCIKASPGISNLFFYSHQYKKQLQLPNYTLQAGNIIEVRTNYQSSSFQFSVIKPIFRHLGAMLFKFPPNQQEFTPIIGMRGNVKVKIINKEKEENLKITG